MVTVSTIEHHTYDFSPYVYDRMWNHAKLYKRVIILLWLWPPFQSHLCCHLITANIPCPSPQPLSHWWSHWDCMSTLEREPTVQPSSLTFTPTFTSPSHTSQDCSQLNQVEMNTQHCRHTSWILLLTLASHYCPLVVSNCLAFSTAFQHCS